jgi:hypothetical protein
MGTIHPGQEEYRGRYDPLLDMISYRPGRNPAGHVGAVSTLVHEFRHRGIEELRKVYPDKLPSAAELQSESFNRLFDAVSGREDAEKLAKERFTEKQLKWNLKHFADEMRLMRMLADVLNRRKSGPPPIPPTQTP